MTTPGEGANKVEECLEATGEMAKSTIENKECEMGEIKMASAFLPFP